MEELHQHLKSKEPDREAVLQREEPAEEWAVRREKEESPPDRKWIWRVLLKSA